jgi:hypothetical protein
MTIKTLQCFFQAAVAWKKNMPFSVYSDDLAGAVDYLNAVVAELMKLPGFNPEKHASTMTMTAVGKYYQDYQNIKGESPVTLAGKLAGSLVAIVVAGRTNQQSTFEALSSAMRS